MDNNNNYNNQQPMNNSQYNNSFNGNIPNNNQRKESGLGIAGMVLSIIGCTFIIGLILSVVDVASKSRRNMKHTCATIGIFAGLFWLFVAAFIGNVMKDGDDTYTGTVQTTVSAPADSNESSEILEEASEEEPSKEPEIEYMKVTVKELTDELNANALRAKETYNGKYVEITGHLSNIDASGEYISLTDPDEMFSFTNVQCFIRSEEQKNAVMEYNVDDSITLKGKITAVGEIMGYAIDIVEFE